MYKAHSKDINRNKSFHPLTYGNLRKVEEIQEQAEERQRRQAERRETLIRDQEERRYDELVLASSADGQSGQVARFKQVKSVFGAEYAAEAQERSHPGGDARGAMPGTSAKPPGGALGGFLSKFKRDGSDEAKVEAVAGSDADVRHRGVKREREDAEAAAPSTGTAEATTTGFITSSEAVRLRRELDLVKKQRLDPLRKLRRFENNTVASAAAAQGLERRKQEQHQKGAREAAGGGSGGDGGSNNEAIQEHIRLLMEKNKKKRQV